MTTTRGKLGATALLTGVVVGLVIVGVVSGGEPRAADPTVPNDFTSALQAHGLRFVDASASDADAARVTASKAESAARDWEGYTKLASDEIHVYLGRLTEENRLGEGSVDLGDGTKPDPAILPPAKDQLVYGVQLSGPDVSEVPHGFAAPKEGEKSPLDDSLAHHEITVFVDAKTGEPILSKTFR